MSSLKKSCNFIINKWSWYVKKTGTFRILIWMGMRYQQASHNLSRPGKYAEGVLLQNKTLLSLGNKYKV